jgi:hypothetical protein
MVIAQNRFRIWAKFGEMSPKRIRPVCTHYPPGKTKKNEKFESDAWGHAAADDAQCSNTLVGAQCFFFFFCSLANNFGESCRILIEVRKKYTLARCRGAW